MPGSVIDEREPVDVALVLALGRGEERLLKLLRHRPAVAHANGAIVDLPDRCDLGGRPGEEDLIGEVQVGPNEVALDDVVAEVAGDRHHRSPRDASECADGGRGRDENAAIDHEDVLPEPSAIMPAWFSKIASS